jgi:signal transduction histidine kinase
MALTLLHLLTWAIIAVSFFNTVALLWLGLTVLLNAERRTWATWAAGGGLLLGGVFFIGHSALVGRNIGTLINELALWWRIGWLPFVGGPYMWYLVIAWYTGVLGAGRHRAWLAAVTALGVAAVALLAFADPLPSFDALLYERAPASSSYECCDLTGGIPAALLIYPVYSLLCVVLSLSALRRPEASERFMGDLARRRARPWLVAASLTLLAVALSVGAAAAWVLLQAQAGRLPELSLRAMVLLIGLDLLVSGMIAVVVVLAGQAIVSYEIFTGKTLPRGGLLRHWRRSLILAAGYGTVVGGSLALPLPIDRIWHLLLATALMTLFFALLSWRSYTDRDRSMGQLRLFATSQHLYDSIVSPTSDRAAEGPRVSPPGAPEEPAAPLRALCEDVLGARLAHLLPLGPLASLVEPLAFPAARKAFVAAAANADGGGPSVPGLSSPELLRSSGALCLPLDQAASGGAEWAVPLWSERGLIGALLLGPKRDGGLYTQEEIELARTTGERLIDTAASAEMARRLVLLQRQRLAESQVIDRRTRRVLHDDVLPRIQETMITLQATAGAAPVSGAGGETAARGERPELDQAIGALAAVHKQIADLLHAMPPVAAPEVARSGLIGALKSTLEEELAGEFDAVSWQITPEAEAALPQIAPLTAEVAFYAAREVVRNAARHGRAGSDARPLHLKIAAHASANSLALRIEDDGVGLRADTATAGSRRGLELHSTMMAVVGGSLDIQSVPGSFTRATLTLPLAQPGDRFSDRLVITK